MVLTRRLRILHTFLCTAERASPSIVAALVAEGLQGLLRRQCFTFTPKAIAFFVSHFLPDLIFNPAWSDFDHELLGESCFRIMTSGLRFNMGDIQSSSCSTATTLRHCLRKLRRTSALSWNTRLATGLTTCPRPSWSVPIIFVPAFRNISKFASCSGLRP